MTEIPAQTQTHILEQTQMQTETPAQTQTQAQTQAMTERPAQTQIQTLAQTQIQTEIPTQTQLPTPAQTQMQTPAQSQMQTPATTTQLPSEWVGKIPKFNTSCLFLQAGLCESHSDGLFPEFYLTVPYGFFHYNFAGYLPRGTVGLASTFERE